MNLRLNGAVIVLILLGLGCEEPAQTTPEDPPVPVTIAVASSGDFPVKRNYPAIASSPWKIDIIARVEGWLETRNFEQGDFVEKDAVLFSIEQAPYEAALLAARASLAEAEAQKVLAQIVVDRNAPLVSSGAVAAEDFDQYEANLAMAQAQVESAAAQVVQAELNLSYTVIRAPIAGRIGATSIDPGTLVRPGSEDATLCTLVSANPIRINFAPSANEFPEYLAKWTKHKPLHASVTIPRKKSWSREGTITFVDNTANPDTSLIRMWTDVDNTGYELLPGQYCEATVTMDVLENVVTIPSAALLQVASDVYVWKIDSNDTVTETKVVVEMQQDGTAVLKSGLKHGDRIVQDGLDKIRFNGTKIAKAPPPKAPGTPPPGMTNSGGSSDANDSKKSD